MGTFAIAVADVDYGTNEVFIVWAESHQQALYELAKEHDYEGFSSDSIEEIKEWFAEGSIIISDPVLVTTKGCNE